MLHLTLFMICLICIEISLLFVKQKRREVSSTAGSVSSRGSERRMKRRPPPGTKQLPVSAGPGSVLTLVTDSGVVSGSNSTVTDTERRYGPITARQRVT